MADCFRVREQLERRPRGDEGRRADESDPDVVVSDAHPGEVAEGLRGDRLVGGTARRARRPRAVAQSSAARLVDGRRRPRRRAPRSTRAGVQRQRAAQRRRRALRFTLTCSAGARPEDRAAAGPDRGARRAGAGAARALLAPRASRRRRGPCRASWSRGALAAGGELGDTHSCTSGPLNGAPNTSRSRSTGPSRRGAAASASVRTSTCRLGAGTRPADEHQFAIGHELDDLRPFWVTRCRPCWPGPLMP
jgi:hypothetical protein